MDATLLNHRESDMVEYGQLVESRVKRSSLAYRIIKSSFDFTASLIAGVVLIVPVTAVSLLICLKDHVRHSISKNVWAMKNRPYTYTNSAA